MTACMEGAKSLTSNTNHDETRLTEPQVSNEETTSFLLLTLTSNKLNDFFIAKKSVLEELTQIPEEVTRWSLEQPEVKESLSDISTAENQKTDEAQTSLPLLKKYPAEIFDTIAIKILKQHCNPTPTAITQQPSP